MSGLFDLSRLSFNEFVRLFFDHDITKEGDWYQNPKFNNLSDFDDEGVASPFIVVEHMTRLFTNFADIASQFSLLQTNAAIWAMFTYGFRLQKHLWLPSVPFQQRVECIRSMYFVYADYVAKSTVPVMENCFLMWWDFVANGFWEHLIGEIEEGDVASLNGEQRALLDAIFETLSKILTLPDERTQGYALHGLGHLHHPDVPQLLQKFIDQHSHNMSADAIRWVEMCRDGKLM
jgi:hypothetical protein